MTCGSMQVQKPNVIRIPQTGNKKISVNTACRQETVKLKVNFSDSAQPLYYL
jgi:hypothetical protein